MPTTCSASAERDFRASILAEHPDFRAEALGSDAWARLGRLALASPLYAQVIRRDPSVCFWLEDERNG